jgi:hypothetical protein
MEKKQLVLTLKSIGYSGDNVGSDIRLHITVEGEVTTITKKIKHGTLIPIKKDVLKKEIAGNFSIPIHVRIIEEDPVFDDEGAGSSNFSVAYNSSTIQNHSFNVSVIGDPIGDRNKIAIFSLNFEAELKDIGIKYVKDVSKRGWLGIKHEDNLTSPKVLPYALKLQVKKIENEREFFVIKEGPLKGHEGSVRLSDTGTSSLTEENLHTGSVYLIYSKKNETLQIKGNDRKYSAISDPSNPLVKGIYDLEIPDEPHPHAEYYEIYSIYAKMWFRIGHSGDRYLHFGRVSAGCITVKAEKAQKDSWNEIYNLLIRSRKGDSLSVGTVEIVD